MKKKKLNELKTMILDSWGYHQYCVIQDQHKRAIKYKIEDIVDVINSIDNKDIVLIALIHYIYFINLLIWCVIKYDKIFFKKIIRVLFAELYKKYPSF